MFHSRTTGIALVLPAAAFTVVAFLLPVGFLLSVGFRTETGWGLAAFTEFFAGELNRTVFWRTLRLGALVTFCATVLGYASAWSVTVLGPGHRGRLIGLLILPLMVSPVARTYAWIVLLGRTGVVNNFLTAVGISSEPIRFLFTETAVFIGLLQLFLPLMILPLMAALENLPADVVAAARVLGAGWFATFTKVVLPLTREGLVVGCTLVFTGSLTAYITPAILGGSKVLMLETLLYQRVAVAGDYVAASVIATILVVMTFTTSMLVRRLSTPRR